MQNDKMDASTVYTMFEEIKENQTKHLTSIEKMLSTFIPTSTSTASVPALNSEDSEKIEMLTKKLDNVSEQLGRPLKHHHTIDFMGNWALISLVLTVGAFIASLWVIDNQRQTIAQFRDNDLKYRYIRMRGEATPEDILRLRELFEFNRAPDKIKLIRRHVERYEQLILQQAENEARARLNASEAERLNSEAEQIKKSSCYCICI